MVDYNKKIKELEKSGIEVDLTLIGRKAQAFFSRLNLNIISSVDGLGEKPTVDQLIGSVKVMLDAYNGEGDAKQIDELWLFANDFVFVIGVPCRM